VPGVSGCSVDQRHMDDSARTAWISNSFDDTPPKASARRRMVPLIPGHGVQSENRDQPGPHDEGASDVR
jgi:hypothetical protein